MRSPIPLPRPVLALGVALLTLTAPAQMMAAPIDFLEQVETDDTRLARVLASLRAGLPDQARARLQPVLAANPTLAPAHELLGVIAAQEGDLEGAIAAFTRAIELDPRQYTAITKLGDVYLALGARDAARVLFARAASIAPADRLSHQRLGLLAEEDGDIAAAIRHYEAGIRDMPETTLGVRINLAILYNAVGAPDRALALLTPFAGAGDALVRRTLAQARLSLGDAGGAIADYRAALAADAQDRAAALGLGAALLVDGDDQAARDLLAPLHAGVPSDPGAAMMLARAQLAGADPAAAEATLRAALPAEGRAPPDLYLMLGAVQQAEGDLAAAADTYATLRRAHPDAPAAYLAQGGLFGLQRDYDAALEAFEAGLALAPDQPGLLRGAMRAHQQQDRTARARDLARSLAATDAVQPLDLYYLGTLEETAGDATAAIAAYRRATDLDPDLWPALNNLAVLLIAGDGADAALPLARRAQALRPDHPSVLHTLGLALLRTGDLSAAAPLLHQAHDLAPGNPAYLRSLAEAAIAAGQRDAAGAFLTQALAAGMEPAQAVPLGFDCAGGQPCRDLQ